MKRKRLQWLLVSVLSICAAIFLLRVRRTSSDFTRKEALPEPYYGKNDLIARYRRADSLQALKDSIAHREAVERNTRVRQTLSAATDYASLEPALRLIRAKSPNLQDIPAIPPLKKPQNRATAADWGPPSYAAADPTRADRSLLFKASYGTPVYATLNGEVVTALKRDSTEGNALHIRNELGFEVVYGYLSNLVVLQNMRVSQGDVVGYVGHSSATGQPQLSYQILKNGVALDPEPFLTIRERLQSRDSTETTNRS